MKNSELWDNYRQYTHELTGFARKLAFAAAAICWLFHSPDFLFPNLITVALLFIVIYFFLDVLQFFIASSLWRNWIREQELAHAKDKVPVVDQDYQIPESLDRYPFILWWIKILFLLGSFSLVSAEFIRRLINKN